MLTPCFLAVSQLLPVSWCSHALHSSGCSVSGCLVLHILTSLCCLPDCPLIEAKLWNHTFLILGL